MGIAGTLAFNSFFRSAGLISEIGAVERMAGDRSFVKPILYCGIWQYLGVDTAIIELNCMTSGVQLLDYGSSMRAKET